MPRRHAPTALRLHNGPMPTWDQPRHVLPQIPSPTLAPARPLPKSKIPSLQGATTQFKFAATWTSMIKGSLNAFLAIDVKDPAVTNAYGPWDRSKSFIGVTGGGWGTQVSELEGRVSPITPPKPVVSIPSPNRAW